MDNQYNAVARIENESFFILSIGVLAGLAAAIFMVAPIVAKQLVIQYQFTAPQIGGVFSAELAGMSLATFPAYWWSSKFNWRKVAFISVGIAILFDLLSVFAVGEFSLLLGLRFCRGLGAGSIMVLCLSSSVICRNPNRAYGVWMLGQLSFGVIGLAVFPYLFEHFGLKSVFVSLVVLLIPALPFCRAFPHHVDKIAKKAVSSEKKQDIPLLKGGAILLAIFVFYLAINGVWSFLSTHLGVSANLTPTHEGLLISGAALAGACGASVVSIIGNRVHQLFIITTGYILLAVSVALFYGEPAALRFVLATLIFKFTWTFLVPLLLSSLAKVDETGKLLNTANLVTGGGLSISPLIAGYILEYYSAKDLTFFLSYVMVVIAISFILAFVVVKSFKD